jgi:eukaryotic-like serine/threonine-protein kinase
MATDPREERIEALFHGAADLPLEERPLFLEDACRDAPELRAEVEALLETQADASEFFTDPAWKLLADSDVEQPPPESGSEAHFDPPVERLGEFRLIRKLGEGGMGVVYLAEQEPFGRLVALKVFRSDRFGPIESHSRFLQEIRAVSELRHPNIVTLFASGEKETLLYYAMEYVEGASLDEKLRRVVSREKKLPISRILKWIWRTADALDFAHQAGIIHRDVKPSNILISTEDRAMLTDFGIAKQANLPSLTRTGDFRGTPHYASPEQVKARRNRIDARTDIYSLGVTLYEAVTGRVPFAGETTDQIFHQILTAEPIPLRRLNPGLSRDIETVTMKALEKDPGRRYQTMRDFADDLERIIKGELILARPAGLGARFWKSVKRNPVTSTAVSVVLLAAVCFSGYILLVSHPKLQAEIEKTEKALGDAEKTISFLCDRVLASFEPSIVDDVAIVDAFLGRSKGYIDDELKDVPVARARVHRAFAEVYSKMTQWEQASRQFNKALELNRQHLGSDHPETLRCQFLCARNLLRRGNLGDAEPALRKYMEQAEQILEVDHADVAEATSMLSGILQQSSRAGEAVELLRAYHSRLLNSLGEDHQCTLAAMRGLAGVLWNKTDRESWEEGIRLAEQCFEKQRSLPVRDPRGTLGTMFFLSIIAGEQGDYKNCLRLRSEWVQRTRRKYGDDKEETLCSRVWLAEVIDRSGDFRKAEDEYEKVLKDCRQFLGEGDSTTALAISDLGVFLSRRGRYEDAIELQQESLDAREKACPGESSVLLSLYTLADTLRRMGRCGEAENKHLEAQKKTDIQKSRGEQGVYLSTAARIYEDLKRPKEAEREYLKAMNLEEELSSRRHSRFAVKAADYAGFLVRSGRYLEAEVLAREALKVLQGRFPKHYSRFEVESVLGAALAGQRRFKESEGHLLEAHEGLRNIPYAYYEDKGSGLASVERLVSLYESWEKPEETVRWQARLDELRATLQAVAKGTYSVLETALESGDR